MLKKLVTDAESISPDNEILQEENSKKRFDEMKKDLKETIDYLDSCSENELLWATEVLEDLNEFFKSDQLIKCIERNTERCTDEYIKSQLQMTLDYIYKTN